jgi:hypothetical protein
MVVLGFEKKSSGHHETTRDRNWRSLDLHPTWDDPKTL